jgi:hypothetical protein
MVRLLACRGKAANAPGGRGASESLCDLALEAAREEGLSEELATIEEVEVEVRAAINAVRKRRR